MSKALAANLDIFIFCIVIGCLFAPVSSYAQSTTDSQPAFEVASVRPLQSNSGLAVGGGCRGADNSAQFTSGPFAMGMGRCLFSGMTLKGLISIAYDLNVTISANGLQIGSDRVTGGSSWTDSDRFRIEAKSENSPTDTHARLLQMLQTLLVERFKLKFHHGTKEVSGFTLVIAKNGSRLKELPNDEPHKGLVLRNGLLKGQTTISELADALSLFEGTPIVDQTKLTGRYEINLNWTPDNPAGTNTPGGGEGPSIFTAVQEQLGFRLLAQKTRIDILTIDSAEKPGEN